LLGPLHDNFSGTMTSRDSFLTFVVAKPFGIDLGKLTLVVDVVKKGGQADRFGVKAGWRLLGVGDREVVIFDDLAEIVASLKNAGEKTCIVCIHKSSNNLLVQFFS